VKALALIGLLLAPALAGAAPLDRVKAGDEAFLKGDFAAAVKSYRAALAEGATDADVYYNLGTAEAESGHVGPSIWALEQALLLRPGHADAAHNLEQVRKVAVSKGLGQAGDLRVILPGEDDLGTGLLTAVHPRVLAWTFAAAWALAFALLIVVRRTRDGVRRTALAFGAVLAGLGALAAGGLLAGRVFIVDPARYAVVTDDATDVRAGPADRYRATARVLAGVKVRLLGRDGAWHRVTLPDGADGWLPDSAVAPLGRPGDAADEAAAEPGA
jgi:hypothetical protein